jgi:hypothetical protein
VVTHFLVWVWQQNTVFCHILTRPVNVQASSGNSGAMRLLVLLYDKSTQTSTTSFLFQVLPYSPFMIIRTCYGVSLFRAVKLTSVMNVPEVFYRRTALTCSDRWCSPLCSAQSDGKNTLCESIGIVRFYQLLVPKAGVNARLPKFVCWGSGAA